MIDPGTKAEGEEFEAYNVRRWGSSGWTHSLKRSGRQVGANFNEQADNKPSSSECNAAIFDAMYERGENVSLTDTLVKIATNQLGVSESEADQLRAHLESNAGSKAVVKEIQEGRKKYNISGVPFFVIGASRNGRFVGRPYGFSGAQNSETFEEIFGELAVALE
ncbi:hypothetical protein ACHAWO_004482 [Cyclotella atomus]|uniref:DSBA-like thioredoxin domain-containing protein n=1 Tax=Cyclotella atomus TaxID=382360 RepID=A0ABD3NWR5_9STRA